MKKLHIGLHNLKKAANVSKNKMTLSLKMEIDSCFNCPLRHEQDYDDDYCGHPSLPNTFEGRNIIDSTADITGFPKLCPLRKENEKQKE